MQGYTAATPLVALEAVVLDTETTGLDARTARIVQIGARRVRGGRLLPDDAFDFLVNPGVPIPAVSSAIHGLGDADVRDAPPFSDVAAALDRFIGDAIVIGHTIGYDVAVLSREAQRAGITWRRLRTLDIRFMAELALPMLAHYDLDRVAEAMDIAVIGRHTAPGDAMTTAQLFIALVPRLREKGIRTLRELEQASRALADRQIAAGQALLVAPPPASDPVRALSRIDSFPYRHLVGDVMTAPAIWCEPTATVAHAIHLLIESRISSVLIRDADSIVGIATERDLLRVLERQGPVALGQPVTTATTKPLQTVRSDSYVYRAIGRLSRLGLRHLPVTDAGGTIVGMVTTRNLLRHRAQSAIALGDEIEAASDVASLAAAWGHLPLVARSLIDEDVEARTIAHIISTEVCALTRRSAELAEARMLAAGRRGPPCGYAVLVLGSAGRGESLLAADQDNAIIYASGASDGPEDRWFAEFAEHLCEILDAAGVPRCKGGVMAVNATWRKPVDGWLATASGWVRRQRPEDLLNVDIFFDAVVAHGDEALAERVIAHAFEAASAARDFQVQLSELARRWQSPFTLLGNLRSEADGRIDLKKAGLFPTVTAARVLAIRHGLRDRGTPARLRSAIGPEVASDSVERLIEAHHAILRIVLRQQLTDIEAGVPPTPRVDWKHLPKQELARLHDALKAVRIAADLAGEGRI